MNNFCLEQQLPALASRSYNRIFLASSQVLPRVTLLAFLALRPSNLDQTILPASQGLNPAEELSWDLPVIKSYESTPLVIPFHTPKQNLFLCLHTPPLHSVFPYTCSLTLSLHILIHVVTPTDYRARNKRGSPSDSVLQVNRVYDIAYFLEQLSSNIT